jgi:hypothetical protein
MQKKRKLVLRLERKSYLVKYQNGLEDETAYYSTRTF